MLNLLTNQFLANLRDRFYTMIVQAPHPLCTDSARGPRERKSQTLLLIFSHLQPESDKLLYWPEGLTYEPYGGFRILRIAMSPKPTRRYSLCAVGEGFSVNRKPRSPRRRCISPGNSEKMPPASVLTSMAYELSSGSRRVIEPLKTVAWISPARLSTCTSPAL